MLFILHVEAKICMVADSLLFPTWSATTTQSSMAQEHFKTEHCSDPKQLKAIRLNGVFAICNESMQMWVEHEEPVNLCWNLFLPFKQLHSIKELIG